MASRHFRFPGIVSPALLRVLCLVVLLVGAVAARSAAVMIDNYSGTRLGTRNITLYPLPQTSTTPQATYNESGGVMTAVMGGNGNGVAGILLEYTFGGNVDLTSGGTNTQFFLEFDQIYRTQVQEWETALHVTMSVTDAGGTTGTYGSVGISNVNAFNIVLNFNAPPGTPRFEPPPNFTQARKVTVMLMFPQNYGGTSSTTVKLNTLRCTPTGGIPPVAPAATVSNVNGDNVTGTTVTYQVAFTADYQPLSVNGFSAADVTLGGTAPGTKTAAVSGGPSTYTVVVSGMTGSGTVTCQVNGGLVTDAWDQTNSASNLCSVNFTKAIPPTITSTNTTTFQEGVAGSFTPTATASPAATFSCSGTLPGGVSFTGGSFTGTPNAATAGNYTVTLTASNGFAPNATQSFTLVVVGPPRLSTPTATSIGTTTATLGGTITNTGNSAITGAGVAYGTAADPTTAGTKTTSSATSTGAFTVGPTGLSSNTLYHYRAYATNAIDTGYTADSTFTTRASAPTIAIPAGTVTTNSFVVNWTPPSGTATITEYRLDVSTVANFATRLTGYDNLAVAGTTKTVTGLSPNTTYYVGVRAVNAGGTGDNATAQTTTIGVAPAFTSANTTTFQEGVAGTFTPAASGAPTPTITCSGTLPGGVTFSAGVLSGTANAGTAGNYPLTFTAANSVLPNATQSFTLVVVSAPTLSTPTATSVDTTTATLGGTITSIGNSAITGAGVAYGTAANPATTGPKVTSAATSTGAFTVNATGLSSNTLYHYRAYATNAYGTGYTADGTFTTRPSAPAVTIPAGSITINSIVINWTPPSGAATITEYRVDVSTVANFATRLTGYDNLAVAGTTLTVTGLTPSTTYYVQVRAVNAGGTSDNATAQATTLGTPPAFTSAATVTFQEGVAGTFTPAASGLPAATITLTAGTLPGGITFAGGVLSGTANAGTAGNYPLTFTAANSVLPNATQSFTLVVVSAPTLSTPTASAVTQTTATAGGTIATLGNSAITGAGVAYGTSADPTTAGAKVTSSATSTGAFTVNATGLSSNTLYHYRAYATNAYGTGYTADGTFTTPADAPTVTISTITPTGFVVSWTPPGGTATITGYRLDVSTSATFATKMTGYDDLIVAGTSQTVTGLAPGTLYYTRVRAVNAGGPGLYDNAQATTTVDAPGSVSASDGTVVGSVDVTWPAVTGATVYKVYRAETAEGARTALTGWTANTSFTDIPPLMGTDYLYTVRAASSATATISDECPADTGWAKIPAPTNVAASSDSAVAVTITWTAVDNLPATARYRVYRSLNTEPPSWMALTGWIDATTATDTTATAGEHYLYAVTASVNVDGARESAQSIAGEGWKLLPVYQPDLEIQGPDDVEALGGDIYDDEPAQTTTGMTNDTAVYTLLLGSDANLDDAITLTGPAGASGWLVRYFTDGPDAEEITGDVTDTGGWTRALAPGEQVTLRVEVTAEAAVNGFESYTAVMSAISGQDDTRTDLVVAIITKSPVQSVTLDRNLLSPVLAGQTVRFTASTVGGGTPEYRFVVATYAGGLTTYPATLPDFAASNIFDWTPTAAGTYVIIAFAREQGTVEPVPYARHFYTVKPSLTGVSLMVTPTDRQLLGETLTLKGTAAGGTKPEFKFLASYEDGGATTWITLRNYGAATTWTGTLPADAARDYTLYVYAREQGMDFEYLQKDQQAFTTCVPLTGVGLVVSPGSPRPLGTTFTLTATPTGGANVEYEFRAKYTDDLGTPAWVVINGGFTADTTCTWTPDTPRTYTLYVTAREEGAPTTAHQFSPSKNITITPALTALDLTVAPASPRLLGTPLSMRGTATGGANVEYAFKASYLTNEGATIWLTLQAYGPSNFWMGTLPTNVARTYTLYAYAREVGDPATELVDSAGYTTVALLSSVSLTILPSNLRTFGATVTLTAVAVGGLHVEYEFKAKYTDAYGNVVWVPIQPFTLNGTSCTWKPKLPRTYTVYVTARETGWYSSTYKYASKNLFILPR